MAANAPTFWSGGTPCKMSPFTFGVKTVPEWQWALGCNYLQQLCKTFSYDNIAFCSH